MPFGELSTQAWLETPQNQRALSLLDQTATLRSVLLLAGPNGVGKSALVAHWLQPLDRRLFCPLLLTHASLSGCGLLSALVAQLGKRASFRREANLALIQAAVAELGKVVPLIVLDEAQSFGYGSLEEVRLLLGLNLADPPAFALVLIGDEYLLGTLRLRQHRSLFSHIACHLSLGPWTAPLAVTAMGGKYAVPDNREIPDTMEALWHYPGDTLVTFTQFNANGANASAKPCEIEFRGTKGTLYVRSNGWEVVPENITPNEFPQRSPIDRNLERGWRKGEAPMIEPKTASGRTDNADHARNFLDCLKSRGVCNSDLESAHRSTSITLIANIAMQTKSHLEWDAKAEKFTNHTGANRFLRYDYRAPLKSPA